MAQCKGCGREIVWAISSKTQKKIPLERCKHVYHAGMSGGEMYATNVEEQIGSPKEAFISHFLTCPKANDFSGSKKQQTEMNL